MKTQDQITKELLRQYNLLREASGEPKARKLSRQVTLLIGLIWAELDELNRRFEPNPDWGNYKTKHMAIKDGVVGLK